MKKIIGLILCYFRFHKWHRFSRDKKDMWAYRRDGSVMRFCRRCGINQSKQMNRPIQRSSKN